MAAKKTKVLHHQAGRPAKEFVLVKKHANKTADFADEAGIVVCEGCPIGPQEDPRKSYITIVEDDGDTAKKAAEEAAAAAKKAAEEAEKAKASGDLIPGPK